MKRLRQLFRRRYHGRAIAFSLIFVIFLNISLPVTWAGPEGAQVINGNVSIQQSAYNTTITASDKAIINYSSFDIARPETVQFIQPSNSASVLNRILSARPTNIDGTLLANGRIFFVNPAGIYIGAGARINVNQLVASGLSISNSDFINGRYNFAGGNGSVTNSGDISAEEVYLIGEQVTNSGNISCPDGYVVMATGDRVFLSESGSEIVLEIDASSQSEPADATSSRAGVLNEGTVEAPAGIVTLAAAGDIYSQAISNVGTISVSVETGNAGNMKLTAPEGTVVNSGSIEATSSSGAGGTVQMLGDRVGLFDTGRIDASGSDDGGTVLIGGDYQGRGDIPTASRTYVGPDSSIIADATENGDGGRVIVWADEITRFYGDISVRGGAEAGDGGFVEVSGKETLVFRGTGNVGSVSGETGIILLDPRDITIADTGGDDYSANNQFAENSSTDVTFDADLLTGLGGALLLQANQDILVSEAITTGSTTAVTLQAGRSITINANIDTSANNGPITLTAGETAGSGVQNGDRAAGNAAITIADGVILNAGNADIVIKTSDNGGLTNRGSADTSIENLTTTGHVSVVNDGFTAGSGIVRASADSLITASSVALDATPGNGTSAEVGANGSPIRVATTNLEARGQGGGVYINSPNQGLILGGATLGGLTGVSTAAGDGPLSVTVGTGNLIASEAVSANGSGVVTLDATAADASLTVQADGDVDSGSGLITLRADGDINLNTGGTVGTTTTGGIAITADQDNSGAGTLTTNAAIGNAVAAGGVTMTARDIAINDSLTAGGGYDIQATGSVVFGGATGKVTGSATSTISAGGSIANTGSDEITIIETTGAGSNLTLTATNTSTPSTKPMTIVSGGDLTVNAPLNNTSSTTTLSSADNLAMNRNITDATALSARAGTDGIGDVTFGPGVALNAPIITLRAGDGSSTANTTAVVDMLNNTPTVSTNSLIVEQDGQMGDAAAPWNLNVINNASIDLDLQSYDSSIYTTDADSWQSITATARNNIELWGGSDIHIASAGLFSTHGGVKVVSTGGTIAAPGGGPLDAPVTGFSNQADGIGVGLPVDDGQKAAIVMMSPSQDLSLGADATLTANGVYSPVVNDDRPAIDFSILPGEQGGDPIDVAIYLSSYEHPLPLPSDPYHDVAINSKVSVAPYGTMVIDADDTVTFGNAFGSGSPPPDQTTRLEVVSRISKTLQDVIGPPLRLPYARNPALIGTRFLGKYVLRGDTVLAQVLTLTDPVPWAAPRPLEPETGDEVEGPNTEALEELLNELGIGVQPYVTEAYAASLSTDLRLYRAAEKLQQLIPILEDTEGTRIAGLREATEQFFPSLDALSEEQVSSFTEALVRHKGDGTDYDAAGQCIFALTEYVTILGNDIGWPADKSIGFVMSRYVPRLTEGDEIRIAVIQMQLQKAFGV